MASNIMESNVIDKYILFIGVRNNTVALLKAYLRRRDGIDRELETVCEQFTVRRKVVHYDQSFGSHLLGQGHGERKN